ncbi:MAG: NADP oxidoreductase [Gemmatimonas sp.]|nr:NADP oxidoreductase [Gemmatimonas sp.]
MKILIVGSGNMGRGIATRAIAGKHSVTLHDEDGGKVQALAKELGVSVAADIRDAVSSSDVVIMAAPYEGNVAIARALGPVLGGKIVVEISNPLNDTYSDLVTAPGTSAAETIQAMLPKSAKLVKAFNTTFAGTLVAGQVAGQALDVFIAGDDDAAKATVAEFVAAGGLTPIDVGALHRARQLEAMALLGITLQFRLNTGFGTAWRLVKPTA